MSAFDFACRTRLVQGVGTVERLGELTAELVRGQPQRALVVTDPGVVAAGHVERAEALLTAAGLACARFDGVRENPTTEDVEACVAAAREAESSVLVGFGGGSAIDVAKGANFLLTNGGSMEDYRGRNKAARPLLPLVAVPTTAGTGTETQSFALIADAETHQKMACGDVQAAPRVALLDPVLTTTLPPYVAACTGLDALGHAVESAVTRARTPISDLFSREAFRLASGALPRVLAAPNDLEARGAMLLAAAYAGLAIENSMLGAAHSMANPLTAHFGVVHGQAVGMALPHVVRFNGADAGAAERYAELLLAAGVDPAGAAPGEALARHLEGLLDAAGLPHSFAACGVPADAATELAREASEQWTARFNPREVGEAELRALYEGACADVLPAPDLSLGGAAD
ncbi:MAG: iron-containing alcohol dehydrogenase [Planctomycetota bacterium]